MHRVVCLLVVMIQCPLIYSDKQHKIRKQSCLIGQLWQYQLVVKHHCTFEITNTSTGHDATWLWYNDNEAKLLGVPSEKDKPVSEIFIISKNKKRSSSCDSVVLKFKLQPLSQIFRDGDGDDDGDGGKGKGASGGNNHKIKPCKNNEQMIFAVLVFDVNFYQLSAEERVMFIKELSKHDGRTERKTLLLPNTTKSQFTKFIRNTSHVARVSTPSGGAPEPRTLLTWFVKCDVTGIVPDDPLFQYLQQLSENLTVSIGYKVIHSYVVMGVAKTENPAKTSASRQLTTTAVSSESLENGEKRGVDQSTPQTSATAPVRSRTNSNNSRKLNESSNTSARNSTSSSNSITSVSKHSKSGSSLSSTYSVIPSKSITSRDSSISSKFTSFTSIVSSNYITSAKKRSKSDNSTNFSGFDSSRKSDSSSISTSRTKQDAANPVNQSNSKPTSSSKSTSKSTSSSKSTSKSTSSSKSTSKSTSSSKSTSTSTSSSKSTSKSTSSSKSTSTPTFNSELISNSKPNSNSYYNSNSNSYYNSNSYSNSNNAWSSTIAGYSNYSRSISGNCTDCPPRLLSSMTTNTASISTPLSLSSSVRDNHTKPAPTAFCPKQEIDTIWGPFLWHKTRVDRHATVTCPCNVTLKITRQCRYNETSQSASWQSFDASHCSCSKTSLEIYALSKQYLNSSNVVEASTELARLAFPGWKLTAEEVTWIARTLENIVDVVKDTNHQVAENFLSTIDSVHDADILVLSKSQEHSNSSTLILKLFSQFLETITVNDGASFHRMQSHFVVDVFTVEPNSTTGLLFTGTMKIELSSTNTSRAGFPKDSSSSKATIYLPDSVFSEAIPRHISKTLILTLFRTSKLFQTASYTESLNSYVIAASIKDHPLSNLSEPVVLTFTSLTEQLVADDKVSCVYWSVDENGWSENGCTFQRILDDGRVVCHCNHLTNFAMLLNVHIDDNQTIHDEILSIISYIGCCLSFLALTCTIITILLVRELRNTLPNKILVNFSIALAATLLVFLCASERSKLPEKSMVACRVAAMALHYFVLAAFMWMAVEAYNMYLSFVRVLGRHQGEYFLLKSCIVAWGVPGAIVLVTAAVSFASYGHTKYCRLHGIPFFVTFLAPIIVIVFVNSITFVLIIHALLNSQRHMHTFEKRRRFKMVRRALAILVLLGLTWAFGFLSVGGTAGLVFQYLFCILNPFQGVFVFLFYCVFPSKTRAKYKSVLGWSNIFTDSTKHRTPTVRGKQQEISGNSSGKGSARQADAGE